MVLYPFPWVAEVLVDATLGLHLNGRAIAKLGHELDGFIVVAIQHHNARLRPRDQAKLGIGEHLCPSFQLFLGWYSFLVGPPLHSGSLLDQRNDSPTPITVLKGFIQPAHWCPSPKSV